MRMTRAVVLSAVRTPVGRYGGGARGRAARRSGGARDRARRSSAPGSTPPRSRTSGSGCANQAGEDNRNVARMAALLAGLPQSVAGVTVNRLCASGLAAVVGACHAVAGRRRRPLRRGRGRVDVARAARDRQARHGLPARRPRPSTTRCSAGGSRTRGSRRCFPLESMGETGENVAERWDVSRAGPGRLRARVAAALGRSATRRAASPTSSSAAGDSSRDEHPRPDTTRRSSPR